MDKKLTDVEIVKALECCASDKGCKENKCPFFETICTEFSQPVEKYALDLINRQNAYIEKCERLEKVADKTIATLQAENERLKKENHQFADIGKMYSEVKAEAYKEFAELSIKRICEQVSAPIPSESYIVEKCNQEIYNLLKEKVGE